MTTQLAPMTAAPMAPPFLGKVPGGCPCPASQPPMQQGGTLMMPVQMPAPLFVQGQQFRAALLRVMMPGHASVRVGAMGCIMQPSGSIVQTRSTCLEGGFQKPCCDDNLDPHKHSIAAGTALSSSRASSTSLHLAGGSLVQEELPS